MSEDLYVQYGEAGTFWDVSFTPAQRRLAGVKGEIDRVSVEVDTSTGEVTLNAGYEPASPQDRAEQELFDTYRSEIDAALFAFVDRRLRDDPDYAAFLSRMDAAPTGPR